MAVFALKSTFITNRDATPKVLTDAYVAGGEVIEAEGYVQTGSAADSVGSTYKMVSIPSNARMSALGLRNQALGAGGAVDIGLYYPTFIPTGGGLSAALAGTVIDATLFASAVAVSSANVAPLEVMYESGTITIPKGEMPLWQMAGLTADPMINLDIVISVQTVLAAQGFIGVNAKYVKQ